MAYINVAEWSPDQVTDWLKGLDNSNSMYHYVSSFTNNEVRGQELLHIRPYELEHLGMLSIGHQEIVLEAVEQLRNFHYHLDKENLQFLAFQVATTSQCLYNQLCKLDGAANRVETQILSDAARTIATIKPLIGWLDRAPFDKKNLFVELRNKMRRYAFELATMAQRDRFVANPVDEIKNKTLSVSKLANYIIQDVTDVMILQPAALNLVTIKKKESELGFNIVPSFNGIHLVTDIKYNSPLNTSGKIEDGDEIVQINYQTVVGWDYKKVMHQLNDSPPDILITLKKRPKHSKIYGQIYMKPYRLPSKKKSPPNRWGAGDSLASPHAPDLTHQPIQEAFVMPTVPAKPTTVSPEKQRISSDSDDCSDIMTPTEPKPVDLYLPKSRAVVQRRNTICGDRVSGYKSQVMFWHKYRHGENIAESPSLRDKSVSFGFGLDSTPRPTTCLGISNAPCTGMYNEFSEIKGSMPEMAGPLDEMSRKAKDELKDESTRARPKPGVSKVVRFDSTQKLNEYKDSKYACNVDNTILEVYEPIPFVDDDEVVIASTSLAPVPDSIGLNIDFEPTQAVNEVLVRREIEKWEQKTAKPLPVVVDTSDIPPAIEPRIEFLLKTPPAPPPRPRKLTNPLSPPPPSSTFQPPPTLQPHQQHFVNAKRNAESNDENTPRIANVIDLKKTAAVQPIYNHQQQQQLNDNVLQSDPNNEFNHSLYNSSMRVVPAAKHFHEKLDDAEELELLTPNKTKNLTLKKKNSIMAKRRNITLKTLEVSDIQGHLYRRVKDSGGITFWAKLYVVLTDTTLYGFKSKDSVKANCLIFLNGFTVSLAKEVHSKPYAFKVYHPSKTFYFSAESQQALSQWIEYIKQATVKGSSGNLHLSMDQPPVVNNKELYSEAESTDGEGDPPKPLATPSPLSFGRFPHKKNLSGSSSSNLNTVGDEPPPKERINLFGSLKKLTKQNLHFGSSSKSDKDKKVSSHNDVPVPTAQFKSYRKVPGNAGLQLGTNSMISPTGASDFVPPLLSSTENHQHRVDHTRKASITSLPQVQTPAPVHSAVTVQINPPTPVVPAATPVAHPSPDVMNTSFKSQREIKFKTKKIHKTSPYNFIHASNPNLVEFNFPTTKTLDYTFPKVNPSNSWETQHSLQGFVTLKDLMLQKQEEDAKEMYNNRVNLGVEKNSGAKSKRHRTRRAVEPPSVPQVTTTTTDEPQYGGSTTGTGKYNKIQSRSLPKTPDYAQSFKPDDSDIIMTRSREGQKLRDFGYEFISGDDTNGANKKFADNATGSAHGMRTALLQVPVASAKKKGSLPWMSSERRVDDQKSGRTGSFKKSKNKLVAETFETFKTSSDKLLQFKQTQHAQRSHPERPHKPTSYLPLTLPLSKKTPETHVYNMHAQNIVSSDELASGASSHSGFGGIKKSVTYNSSADFAADRKLSGASTSTTSSSSSVFNKLPFTSSKTAKDRKLLGSPRLHRAIFGAKRGGEFESTHQDHEKFSPLEIRPRPIVVEHQASDIAPTHLPPPAPTQYGVINSQSGATGSSQSPDYPNLEYPPVFEAETYSLSDPNTSLTLMRRRQNPNHN